MTTKIPITRGDEPKKPEPSKETIYVDVDDDITAIIDKVDAAKSSVVALVLPKRTGVLQSIVNMRLLKRSADKADKKLVLITSEAALLPLAGAAGLHVAKGLQSTPEVPPSPLEKAVEETAAAETVPEEVPDEDKLATKIDYKRSIGELAAAHEVDSDEAITLDEPQDELPEPKVPKSSAGPQAMSKKIKVPNFERFRLMLFGGIALFIALIVFIIFAIFVLPKATIAIQTTSLPVSANLTLDASDKYKTLNEANNQIPAILKASDQTSTQTVNATGQQNQGQKATGTMYFVNCNENDVLQGNPHTVPAGTGVSANGLTYITQEDVTVYPSHFDSSGNCKSDVKSSSVDVKSQSGGAKYNQSSTTYSVAGYSTITGYGSAMTGGTDNNVTVVSQADLDNAKAKITSASSDSFTKTFENQLASQGYYVLTSTLKINDPVVTATPDVGQPATNTTVSIKITYTVMAVSKSDLRKIISDTLNQQVDKSKMQLSNSDVLNGANVVVQNQGGPAQATLNVSEDTTAVPIIDVNQVKSLAVGKKSGDIKNAISTWDGVKNVDVKFSPFWVTSVSKTGKITVKLQQVKG